MQRGHCKIGAHNIKIRLLTADFFLSLRVLLEMTTGGKTKLFSEDCCHWPIRSKNMESDIRLMKLDKRGRDCVPGSKNTRSSIELQTIPEDK